MAKPQLENGYTSIANELLEALAKIRISGEAMQVLGVIIRKTYGFHKKKDRISLSQFSLATGMKRPTVCRAINKLISMKIIIKIDNDNGEIYAIQKDFDEWVPLSKKITLGTALSKKIIDVIKKDNVSLSKKIHTKDNNTKEIVSKDTKEALGRNKDIDTLIEKLKSEFELKVLDGSDRVNRQYAWLMLKKCKSLGVALKIIELAAVDDFYHDKITSFKPLYYKMVEISQRAKSKERGEDKPKVHIIK